MGTSRKLQRRMNRVYYKYVDCQIEFNVTSDKTSLRTILDVFYLDIALMVHNAMGTSRTLQQQMNQVYYKYVDYLVIDLTTSLETADRLFAAVYKGFVIHGTVQSEEIDMLIETLDSIIQKLEEFDHDLGVTSAYARQLFPKRLVNSTSCLSTRKKLMRLTG